MAEHIYPEGIRTNVLAGMYSEIAMESYFYAKKYHDILKENNYSAFFVQEEQEMYKNIVKTVVFSAMSIESFFNDYAAACLGDSEFYSNFDKLSSLGKFQLIAKFILKSKVEKEEKYYFYLKTLFSLRDSYVHNKSTQKEIDGFTNLEDFLGFFEKLHKGEFVAEPLSLGKSEIDNDYKGAVNALKAIKEIALYFDKYDANRFAIQSLLHPLGLKLGSEKEKEYKAVAFKELGIKADGYYEIQI